VLEFDEFMKIQGCSEKPRHLFIGKGKKTGQEKVEFLRSVVTASVRLLFSHPWIRFMSLMKFI
jgi:hypothetical protein